MEFQDRQATNPGRVILKNVSTGVQTTYDVTFADGVTVGGTPLNKQTFDTLKEDILNQVETQLQNYSGNVDQQALEELKTAILAEVDTKIATAKAAVLTQANTNIATAKTAVLSQANTNIAAAKSDVLAQVDSKISATKEATFTLSGSTLTINI